MVKSVNSLEALRRLKLGASGPKFRESSSRLPAAGGGQSGTVSRTSSGKTPKIGHTALPPRFEVVCYECDYAFTLQGHMHETFCPKCHKSLEIKDFTIASECTEPVKTIGDVTIAKGAIIKTTLITGKDIIISGDARGTFLKAYRTIELQRGAKFELEKTRIKNLKIKSGRFTFRQKISCRNLEVEGKVKLTAYIDEVTHIMPKGILEGEIHTPHLIVEDGAILNAKVIAGIKKEGQP